MSGVARGRIGREVRLIATLFYVRRTQALIIVLCTNKIVYLRYDTRWSRRVLAFWKHSTQRKNAFRSARIRNLLAKCTERVVEMLKGKKVNTFAL